MDNQAQILLVEDDADWLGIYLDNLKGENYLIETARTVNHALTLLRESSYDVVVTDLKMLGFEDEFGGFSILARAKEINPATQVVVITGFGSRDIAFRATQQGAFDYIVKPPETQRFRSCIRRALEAGRLISFKRVQIQEILKNRNDSEKIISSKSSNSISTNNIIGNSQMMMNLYDEMNGQIDTSNSILLWGELGTGKELIARTIHSTSKRRSKPFSYVDCGNLLRYWQTILRNIPRIQGGTIFFDDLSQITNPAAFDSAGLITALQENDVRLIASLKTKESSIGHGLTNSLFGSVLESILQIRIRVPALRERKDGDDISALAGHFTHIRIQELSPGSSVTISPNAMKLIVEYDYPTANVRELRDLMKNAVDLLYNGPVNSDTKLSQNKV